MSSPREPWPLEPDALDRLLLRAPVPAPDGWFTARTLARCRNSEPAPGGFARLRAAWSERLRPYALAGIGAFVLGVFVAQQVHHRATHDEHARRNVQEAFEVVASLGPPQVDPAAPGDSEN